MAQSLVREYILSAKGKEASIGQKTAAWRKEEESMGSIDIRRAAVVVLFLALLCTGALAQAVSPGAAQAYPVKPLRLIVPFPAGASSDIVGRMLAQKLSEQLGEQVVPDNRPAPGEIWGSASRPSLRPMATRS